MDLEFLIYATQAHGLEVTVKQLRTLVDDPQLEDLLETLRVSKIARLGLGADRRFSFVHRRFQEYFVSRHLSEHPETVSFESIPTDSRRRDALVMFCETADERTVSAVADQCWHEVRRAFSAEGCDEAQYLRGVHCLRFLRDAFGSRRGAVSGFQVDLAQLMLEQVSMGDVLSAKLMVEATGVLGNEFIEEILLAALKRKNPWINDTAFRSCRHLAMITGELSMSCGCFCKGSPSSRYGRQTARSYFR